MKESNPFDRDTVYWEERLREVYAGRSFIVSMPLLATAIGLARELERFGVERTLCVAVARGAMAPDDVEHEQHAVVLHDAPPHASAVMAMMPAIRANLRALDELSEEARQRIEAFDPLGKARSLGEIFDSGEPVHGRAKFGARADAWQALEDKTVIDTFWEQAGLQHAPYRVVELEGLEQAFDVLADDQFGCVFAVDNTHGFHGGASGTEHVRDREELKAFAAFHAAQGIERVRVMPYLRGIPCSIHGLVFPDYVMTLRPCEMLIYRSPSSRAFFYAGSATFWEAPTQACEAMRQAARRVGERLREQVDYRGAFTIDGVLTPTQGFLPTELNPRFGAALGHLGASLPQLPLRLLDLALVEEEPIDWRPRELEALLRRSARAERRGALGMTLTDRPTQSWTMALCRKPPSLWHIVSDQDEALARLSYSPTAQGSYLRVSAERAWIKSLDQSEPFAPSALGALRFAQRTFGLSLPKDLIPACHQGIQPEHARYPVTRSEP